MRLSWDKDNKRYHAYNSDDVFLGDLVLRNVGAHMHWCWEQCAQVYMSPGCLQEVRDKQKELFAKRKVVG